MSEQEGSDQGSVVVGIDQLDTLLDLAGKVIIVSSNLEVLNQRIENGEAHEKDLAEESKGLAITASRISADLHSLVVTVRNVGMKDVFARFRRLTRDTSRRIGKTIRFEVSGEDVTLDKTTMEAIYDPIAHQLRNAIVHGIEHADDRTRAGKDPVGTVSLAVETTEQQTTIRIKDDGNGIDIEAIRHTAIERGFATERQLERMSRDELFGLLFEPGFSTQEQLSGEAGRGVGLDVVRSTLDQLEGEWRIESEDGVGSTFTFLLPNVSAVNIADTLMIKAGDSIYAFPITTVVATLHVKTSEFHPLPDGGRTLLYLGEYIAVADLSEVFSDPPAPPAEHASLILVQHKGTQVAFIVSEFLAPQKVVISELDKVTSVEGIHGAAVLSGQRLGLVIDVPALIGRVLRVQRTVTTTSNSERILDTEPEEVAAPAVELGTTTDSRVAFEAPGNAFLEELTTLLGRFNRELLALDESRDRDQTDAVFRLAHSIKGNLAMYGVDGPASVMHQLETLLDRARDGRQELIDDSFDVFFDGCSYLESVVEQLKRGEAPSEPSERLTEGLEGFSLQRLSDAAESSPGDFETAEVELDASGEFTLSSRRQEGAPLRQTRIAFQSSDQPNYLLAYLILRRIQRIGDVIGSWPAIERIEAGECGNGMVVLFSPRSDGEESIERLKTQLSEHYGVTRFSVVPFC